MNAKAILKALEEMLRYLNTRVGELEIESNYGTTRESLTLAELDQLRDLIAALPDDPPVPANASDPAREASPEGKE